MWGIHRGPANSPHKWPITPKMFPFDDVIMCLCNHGRVILGVYFPNCEATMEIYTKITLKLPCKKFDTVVHTSLYSLHDIISPYMKITTRFAHIDSVSQALCLRSADDITIDCWWRHRCITRCDNCNASTWKTISNSLDSDFVHHHINDRS